MKTQDRLTKVLVWGLAILNLLTPPATAVVWFLGIGSILFGSVVVAFTSVFLGIVAVTIRE